MFLKVSLINLFSCSTDNEAEQEDRAAQNNLNVLKVLKTQ